MTVILATLAGAGIGVGVALALYVLGFVVELVNLACNILTFNCDGGDAIPEMWEGEVFAKVLVVCVIAGAVVGLIYGICKAAAAKREANRVKNESDSEAAEKQRIKWADEVRQKALSVANTCSTNVDNYRSIVSADYRSDSQMNAIIQELANAAELKGKVEAMANDTKTKGGTLK